MVAVSGLLAVADRGGRGLLNVAARLWTPSADVTVTPGRAEALPLIAVAHERHGAGEPIVLLHGLGLDRRVWDPIVPLLAAGHEVIAIDLPGFGESPEWPESLPRDLESAAAVLGAVLTALGIERPHVVGHSLGGLIALKMGQAGLVRSVTALAPAGFWNETERRYAFAVLSAAHRIACRIPATALRRLIDTPLARAILTGMIYADPAKCPPEAVDACVRGLRAATEFESTLRAGRTPDLFTGRIRGVPVTIAWGTADRILPPRQAKRAAAMLPEARLVWLPRCGHIPMYDDPALVADVILQGIQAPIRANR